MISARALRVGRSRRVGAVALVVALVGGVGATTAAADAAAAGISQVKLSYRNDPTTSIAVSWRDNATAGPGVLQLVPSAAADFASCGSAGSACVVVDAQRRSIGSSDGGPYGYYQADATALKPGAAYTYRVVDGAAVSPQYGFTTPSGGNSPLRAAFLGEVHIGDEVQPGWPVPALKPTLEQIRASGAQFVISAGDNINTGTNETEWERLFQADPATFASVPMSSAVGNHETYGAFSKGVPSEQYFAAFPAPANGDGSGRYFSYDVNGVHFAVVEANLETPRPYFDREMAWLDADLKAAAKRTRFQVVVDHSPPFHSKTSRVTPNYENPEFREQLVPLMDKYGVEMVVSGHDKHYVRSYPLVGKRDRGAVPAISPRRVGPGKGTTYLELTSTGQNYPDFLPQPWMATSAPVSSEYLQLDFGADSIAAKAIRPDGTVLDSFTVPQLSRAGRGGKDGGDPQNTGGTGGSNGTGGTGDSDGNVTGGNRGSVGGSHDG